MGLTAKPRAWRRLCTPATALFVACLAYAVWAASIGWHNTVLDFIGFRQAQTALTTYFMIGRPPTLAYETPVVGPPWSIPFELPVYQWTVAAVVTALGTPLDETGRFVAVTFFLLTLIPGYRLLAWLEIKHEHRLFALCLFVVSPFYIFWSRTFLIESTALFFSLAYLSESLRGVDRPTWPRLAGACLLGVLAALAKITTFFVFLLLLLLYLGYIWLWRREPPVRLRRALVVALLVAIVPFGSGWLWTKFADAQKERNPIGQHLTSTADVMSRWNFGSWGQRADLPTWKTIGGYAVRSVGHVGVLAVALAAMAVARRRWLPFLTCLLIYPIAPLIFINLYWYHEYYSYANNVLLLAAVALALVGLLERGGAWKVTALTALVGFVFVAVWRHQETYVPIQTHNHEELYAVSDTVARVTQSEDVIVVIGCDWSSEVPYYCRRRALCLPVWKDPSLKKMPEYLALDPYTVGAVVIRDGGKSYERAEVERTIRAAGYEVQYHRADADFEVYAVRRPTPGRAG